MISISAPNNAKSASALWQLGLALLLLCGTVSYTAAGLQGAPSLGSTSSFVADLNGLAAAVNSDSLRVKTNARKSPLASEPVDGDDSQWDFINIGWALPCVNPTEPSCRDSLAAQFLRADKYRPQLSRAPPSV